MENTEAKSFCSPAVVLKIYLDVFPLFMRESRPPLQTYLISEVQ